MDATWLIGGKIQSSMEARVVAYIECTCIIHFACGHNLWIAPCNPHAVASGGLSPERTDLSLTSNKSKSDALILEKCHMLGFIKNFVPSELTARLKWFATASCKLLLSAHLNAAAKSFLSST